MMEALNMFIPMMLLYLLVIAIVIATSVFWIRMLVDCLKREFKDSNEKIIWVLVIIFLQIAGALIYWSLVVKKQK